LSFKPLKTKKRQRRIKVSSCLRVLEMLKTKKKIAKTMKATRKRRRKRRKRKDKKKNLRKKQVS